MKTLYSLGIILLIISSNSIAQNKPPVKWKFKTSGKILSSPIVDANLIYFGSNDSTFYALNGNSGKLKWQFLTNHPMRSRALILKERIYFSSGHDVYCLHKKTGKLIWKYLRNQDDQQIQLDYWDYKDGSPIADGNNIYFGFSNGKLLGFDLLTGNVTMDFTTDQMAAIKCGLVRDKNTIYLGDWLGKVYAVTIPEGELKWVKETYEKQLYPTYGQLNTHFWVHKDGLYFGGRNPELNVLDKNSGDVLWSYVEENGGWISGDPFILNDILYIGGSDNHELFSFNASDGTLKWKYRFLNNNFTQPVAYKEYLLFTTGDAYSVFGPSNVGTGYLYALKLEDGSIHNYSQMGGNLNSNMVVKGNMLYVGSEDGFMYAVNLIDFLETESNLAEKGYGSFELKDLPENPTKEVLKINYNVVYRSNIQITLKNIQNEIITTLFDGVKEEGDHNYSWDFRLENKEELKDGYYFIEISSKEYIQKIIFQKKVKN